MIMRRIVSVIKRLVDQVRGFNIRGDITTVAPEPRWRSGIKFY
jgi:hypothetical protein